MTSILALSNDNIPKLLTWLLVALLLLLNTRDSRGIAFSSYKTRFFTELLIFWQIEYTYLDDIFIIF